jgi:YegS/Rv2252/BmrU family lipid kinase
MSDSKLLLILNPTAAQGRAGLRLTEIETGLRTRGLSFEVRSTKAMGHATELAAQAGREGFVGVIAAGGDGTSNEVINGLIEAKKKGAPPVILGVLPVGRGNDFASGLGLPVDLPGCLDVIAGGHKGRLDVGRVSGGDYPAGRCFGNGIGIGFDTRVGMEAAKLTWIRGAFGYIIGAVKVLAIFPEAPAVVLEHDGGRLEGRSHQISIMNGQRMGGSYFMAPDALVDDGLLDLCMAWDLTRRDMAALIIRYTKGSQAGHPKITMARSTKFRITAAQGGLDCHADGETICLNGSALEVECLPAALEAYVTRRV